MYGKNGSYNSFHSRSNNFSMQTLMPLEDVLAGAINQDCKKMVRKQQRLQNFDYLNAKYQKALLYKNQNSYVDKDAAGNFREIQFLEDNAVFQKFGPGIYLYLELFRRLGWTLFVFSVLEILILVMNWNGGGLRQYSINFGNILIYSTLGNYSAELTGYDVYIQTGGHCLLCLLFFIFFIFWKVHNYSTLDNYENGDDIIHPRKFCLEVEGLPSHGITNKDLEIFFANFGPVHEASLVYNYKDQLRFFYDFVEIQQKIKQQQLEIKMQSGSEKRLRKLIKERDQLANQIKSIQIDPTILSAYIHFQYEDSKTDMVTFYSKHYGFSSIFHKFMRSCCCCCTTPMPVPFKFQGKNITIKHDKVPDPEEINWDSFDISWCSKILRVTLAVFLILLFVFICSTLVALCSIFIQTNAINCSGMQNVTYETARDSGDTPTVTCFCNSQMFNFFSTDVQNLCKDIFKTLYIQNLLQIVAAVISSISNLVFGFVLGKIISFTKPNNLSSGMFAQTLIYFIFIFINSIILPVLIYSDLFGVKPASYVSLIRLLFPNSDIFNMDGYQYYADFTGLWYKNVSPFATNFLIIDVIITWGKFFVYLCYLSYKKRSIMEDQDRVLQKSMNERIVSYQVDVVNETSYLFLITFMCMIYCAGIPVVVPLGAVCIISRYLINKHMVIHHSKRVQGLGQNFNHLSVVILPFSVVFGCFVGIWMLTASPYIYPDKINVRIPGTESIQGAAVFFPRIFYISFTFVLGALVVLYIFFYNTIVRLFTWLFSLCDKKQKKISPTPIIKKQKIRFSNVQKSLTVSCSYNIHANEKYKNAITKLQTFLEKK